MEPYKSLNGMDMDRLRWRTVIFTEETLRWVRDTVQVSVNFTKGHFTEVNGAMMFHTELVFYMQAKMN